MSESTLPADPNAETFIPQSTVLIVDDNPQNVELLTAFLESLPVRLVTASDGIEALRKVAEENPDLILLDIMMPHMSGLEVLARLKHDPATTSIPVIMLTAKSQDDDVLTGYKEGAEYYITKPCTSRDLVYGIRLVLGKQRASAPPP